jgi:hypothetical protein
MMMENWVILKCASTVEVCAKYLCVYVVVVGKIYRWCHYLWKCNNNLIAQ